MYWHVRPAFFQELLAIGFLVQKNWEGVLADLSAFYRPIVRFLEQRRFSQHLTGLDVSIFVNDYPLHKR